MVYEFDGTKHGKLRDMQAARRAKHDLIQSTHFNGERTGSGSASSQSVKSKNVSVNQTSHFETTGRTVNPLA
ncbi:hypothetical protein [uncultured Bifidobacterium sp.]|mgnify:CR=1 FL=1|uniref:hypothetical protein n=1 Tax=uncultured Bifidobacterium sp. TaxID=165187 RepID=UPI00258A2B3B|nr:hypothetical protein [uncultured Bifidobacterium sp.]